MSLKCDQRYDLWKIEIVEHLNPICVHIYLYQCWCLSMKDNKLIILVYLVFITEKVGLNIEKLKLQKWSGIFLKNKSNKNVFGKMTKYLIFVY